MEREKYTSHSTKNLACFKNFSVKKEIEFLKACSMVSYINMLLTYIACKRGTFILDFVKH